MTEHIIEAYHNKPRKETKNPEFAYLFDVKVGNNPIWITIND